jgi:hypothetical protein
MSIRSDPHLEPDPEQRSGHDLATKYRIRIHITSTSELQRKIQINIAFHLRTNFLKKLLRGILCFLLFTAHSIEY